MLLKCWTTRYYADRLRGLISSLAIRGRPASKHGHSMNQTPSQNDPCPRILLILKCENRKLGNPTRPHPFVPSRIIQFARCCFMHQSPTARRAGGLLQPRLHACSASDVRLEARYQLFQWAGSGATHCQRRSVYAWPVYVSRTWLG